MPFPWQKPLISVQSYGKGIYLPQLCVSFFANRGNVRPNCVICTQKSHYFSLLVKKIGCPLSGATYQFGL